MVFKMNQVFIVLFFLLAGLGLGLWFIFPKNEKKPKTK